MRTVILLGLAICLLGSAAFTALAQTPVKADDKPWAFRTPQRAPQPAVKNAAWVRTPIDAFLLARMEKAGVQPADEADRATLLRRLSFDLTGLPPTPREVAAFLADTSADAYEMVVDRLLASPRYGERWALYWLDLVRYAESDGFKADDIRPLAWRYRDYVIDALNKDKPYDRFVLEQLAGDELFPDDPQALVATGFNRHYPSEHNAKNIELHRQEILNDMTDTTGQVFLGLTVGCARCHDHKYDPILHTDYYRLQAFFAAFRAKNDQMLTTAEEKRRYESSMQTWQEQTAEVRKKMAELEEPYAKKLVDNNKVKYDQLLQDAYDMPADQRTPYQQQLAEMFSLQLKVDRTAMVKSMKTEIKKDHDALSKELAKYDALKPKALPAAMALTDIGSVAPATYLLQRGNYKKKGEELTPGFLAIFDPESAKIQAPAGRATTGRRTALARWLTQSDHPLTARVMVNRLWQHHFGKGIVGTASDFGEVGEKPTHPELLDWLATEFVKEDWSLKKMHRLMVLSSAYRQSSAADAAALKADQDNRLLSRMPRKRLEGETLRDAMLAVSGLLNLKAGGPSIFPELPAELSVPAGKWPVTKDAQERNRRSVYVFAKRNMRYPLFGAFDAPDGNESCSRRHVSTSAPQALMLLNSKMTVDWARAFAGRVLREADSEPRQVVEAAYRLALGRSPSSREMSLAVDFLDQETKHARERQGNKGVAPGAADPAFAAAVGGLCHVLLNVNEFAYVD